MTIKIYQNYAAAASACLPPPVGPLKGALAAIPTATQPPSFQLFSGRLRAEYCGRDIRGRHSTMP